MVGPNSQCFFQLFAFFNKRRKFFFNFLDFKSIGHIIIMNDFKSRSFIHIITRINADFIYTFNNFHGRSWKKVDIRYNGYRISFFYELTFNLLTSFSLFHSLNGNSSKLATRIGKTHDLFDCRRYISCI